MPKPKIKVEIMMLKILNCNPKMPIIPIVSNQVKQMGIAVTKVRETLL